MTQTHRIESTIHFDRQRKGTKKIVDREERPGVSGKIPRITRLMALAIHFDQLIKKGKIDDYAELARLGNVTRARVTQIMNLLMLAPEIQEEILFLPRFKGGREILTLRQVQRASAMLAWRKQRATLRELLCASLASR